MYTLCLRWSHLYLQAKPYLYVIHTNSCVSRFLNEDHHPCVELVKNVVEVHFRCFLVEVWMDPSPVLAEARDTVLAENLELARSLRFRE